MTKLRIGVIGAGVAGIVCAYQAAKHHHVILFEKNNYLGGHTNTFVIQEGVDSGTAVDTGFIVLNDRTYPNFHKMLDEWGVKTRFSDMSFGYWDKTTDFRYAYTNFNGVFAQRKNLFDYKFWKLSYELIQFFKKGSLALHKEHFYNLTLGEFINIEGFSKELQEKYLLPMGSAIWSIPSSKLLEFPAAAFLHFFANHGLLNISDRPNWQTVEGGSFRYVEAFKKKYKGDFILNASIETIIRKDQLIEVRLKNGSLFHFDKVVIAAHADEALQLLEKPSEYEVKALSPWRYENNHVVLHTDRSIMPKHKRAWASWNFHRENNEDVCMITYHMNRLQGLKTHHDYFVTLNCHAISEQKTIKTFEYTHPVYNKEALESQELLAQLNGKSNTYFCGSYFGYGFHEDAVKSAIEVSKQL